MNVERVRMRDLCVEYIRTVLFHHIVKSLQNGSYNKAPNTGKKKTKHKEELNLV